MWEQSRPAAGEPPQLCCDTQWHVDEFAGHRRSMGPPHGPYSISPGPLVFPSHFTHTKKLRWHRATFQRESPCPGMFVFCNAMDVGHDVHKQCVDERLISCWFISFFFFFFHGAINDVDLWMTKYWLSLTVYIGKLTCFFFSSLWLPWSLVFNFFRKDYIILFHEQRKMFCRTEWVQTTIYTDPKKSH